MKKNDIKVQGNYASIGDGSRAHVKTKKSVRGHFKTAFTKVFDDVTELDMGLRKEYATQLVSQFTLVPEDMLQYRKKTTKSTVSATDEVYYVKRGQETIGKLSIRSQRTFRTNILIVIYQEKTFREQKPQKGIRGQQNYKRK